MPKFVLSGFGQEEVEATGGSFTVYEGPLPPKNKRVRVKVKNVKLKINSAGDPMLKAIAEIDAPKGHPMHQYNGAVAFWNGNLTKKGAGYVNEFLQAIAGSVTLGKKLSEAVWKGQHGGINLGGDGKPKKDSDLPVNAIGTIKFDKDRHAEIMTAHSKVNKGDRKGEIDLAVGQWVLPKPVDENPSNEPVDEDEEGIDEEDGVEVEQEEDDSDEDESDESDEDETDDSDEDDGDGAIAKEPPF